MTKQTACSQIKIKIPRTISFPFLLSSFFDLNFDVVNADTKNRYAGGIDIKSVNLNAIAFFSDFILTTSSGNYFEDISHAHIVCVMYK